MIVESRRSAGECSDELTALAGLAEAEFRRAVGGMAATHGAIADRAFRGVGPTAAPVRAVHDAIALAAWGGVRAGGGMLGRAATEALSARRERDRPALSRHAAGAAGLAVLAGLVGDSLHTDGSPLAPPMSLRVDGEAVPPLPEALAATFTAATARVCVFLHGLMESEFVWGVDGDGRETYGSALDRELGFTPLYVRYNTGRHISENGRELSALLQAIVAGWPVPMIDLVLIGHSMGGLVARSACHQGERQGAGWVSLVRHTVSLGTPHHGAPLPRAVHVADAALHAVPETRALGGLLRRRSAGIRDLRHGSLVDEDWRGRDPHALRSAAVAEVPLLAGATHCFVSAVVTRSASHPLGRLLGDMLVLPASAEGRERSSRLGFSDAHGLRLAATHHLALLRHPRVRAQLGTWLGAGVAA
jgi:hypothetical protein